MGEVAIGKAMMGEVVIGIDSSTQSTKVEARNIETGQVVASGQASHPATTPPVSEQDPNAWWHALVDAMAQIPEEVRGEVAAVSVGGQQHGMVLLDDADQPVRPAKLWNDTTSAPQADRLVAALGAEAWAKRTGSMPVAAFTITKVAWVAEHEPELIDQTAKVMLPHDYLTYRLTGNHVTDRGDASGTGWYSAAGGEYDTALLDTAGALILRDRLARVLGPTEPAGELLTAVAEELGLRPGCKVGPGSGDNMAAALGLGLGAGDLVISLGTSGVAYARSATPTNDPSGAVAGFADASGDFLPLVCTLNATKVTDAVAGWLGTDAPGLADLAATAADDTGNDALVVVPWFDGERTPNRPGASGSMRGLRTDTTPAQIARAAHDGVLCGLLGGVDALGQCGVVTDGLLHLIGGGARSSAYRQRLADLWGRDIVVPDADETVATGAAVQAAAIAGAEPLADIQQRWSLGAGKSIWPTEAGLATAADVRQRYRQATA